MIIDARAARLVARALRGTAATTVALAAVVGASACGDVRQLEPAHETVIGEPPVLVLAEQSAPDTADAADAAASDTRLIFSCESDADCIAVPRAGLCRNGVKEAVNRHHIEAYRKAFAHAGRGAACTFLLIRDRRVAECDTQAGRCVLTNAAESPDLPRVFAPKPQSFQPSVEPPKT